MRILLFILIAAGILCGSHSSKAQELPRKAMLGAYLQPLDTVSNPSDYGLKKPEGVLILQLAGFGTSAALGMQQGDILLSVNGTPLKNYQKTVELLSQKREGDNAEFVILRDKKKKTLKGKFTGALRETDPNADVIYDHVDYKKGKLNVIINKPKKEGKMPAVLFVPGYVCTTVDGLPDSHPYARVIHAFSEAGYVVLRVEKSGLGDNQNTPACEDCTLPDEVEGFEKGLLKLKSLPYVDTENVFIFGHSMGGVIAPQLASKHDVKGLMVYGTTAKSWLDYHLEMHRFQAMLAKPEPIEYEKHCREQAEVVYEYFVEGKELADIAKDSDKKSIMEAMWAYDGTNKISGRNAEYWRELQRVNMWKFWKDSKAKVLVMCGGADFQAFSEKDHTDIVYAVNYYRPNTATYKFFPESDHYLAKVGTYQDAYDLFVQHKYYELFQRFDSEITKTMLEWADKQR